jgi:hypothetical protein
MRASEGLFLDLVDVLVSQFALLEDDWFAPDNILLQQASYLVEDLIDTEIKALAQKGQALADYLQTRNQAR